MNEKRWPIIRDFQILIVASCMGFAWVKLLLEVEIEWRGLPSFTRFTWPVVLFLQPWVLAYMTLRLIRPRRRLRLILGEPGMAAVSAMIVVSLLGTIPAIRIWNHEDPEFIREELCAYWLQLTDIFGLAVAVTWLALIVGRRWRPERSWVDRLGRLLGLVFLLSLAFHNHFGRWISTAVSLTSNWRKVSWPSVGEGGPGRGKPCDIWGS